jgi:two-component system, OmpR family, sensor histidine kinase KdpD
MSAGNEDRDRGRRTRARAYATAALAVLACTLVCRAMISLGVFDHANLIMVYLAGVALVAVGGGHGPSALAAALSVAAFDFFFVPPHLTLAVSDAQYVVTFAVMLAVGLLIATLSVRVREQTEAAERSHALAEAERLRHTLLSSVSHDLRTPLAAITGATSTLLRDSTLDEETRRDLLETASEESHRLNRLVTNLLDMTRLESGPLPLRREWLPLEEVVGSALGRLEGRLGAARVETSLPVGLPLVPIDAVLIEQVLVNLLENALKYAGPASRVTIGAIGQPGAVHVEIADDGPGLPPGDEERIFEKFYRGRSRERGFGLGLAICRAIVAAHGGTIRAEKRVPHGASFQFTLPIAGRPPASLPDETSEADGS